MSPEQEPRLFGTGTHSTCLHVVARFLPSFPRFARLNRHNTPRWCGDKARLFRLTWVRLNDEYAAASISVVLFGKLVC